MFDYLLIGLLWIVLCILIGLYVSGTFSRGNRFYKIGMVLLILSWLAGICMLGAAVVYS